MYLTFPFLNRLSQRLHSLLHNATVQKICFYESTDLWLVYKPTEGVEAALKLHFEQDTCFWMPADPAHIPLRHIPERFPELVGRKITGVEQARNERAFCIRFTGGYTLMFVFYGAKSDVWLFDSAGVPVSDLRKLFKAGPPVTPGSMHVPYTLPVQELASSPEELKNLWPTLGPVGRRAFEDAGFQSMNVNERIRFIHKAQAAFESGPFYLCLEGSRVFLSFFPGGRVLDTFDDALIASRQLAAGYFRYNLFETRKAKLLDRLKAKQKTLELSLGKSTEALHMLRTAVPPERMADLLMAYAHLVPARAEVVELPDFEDGNPVLIKLKKENSAHKNAENYYRKAKNRHLQLQVLENKITGLKAALQNITLEIEQVKSLEEGRALQTFEAGTRKKNVAEAEAEQKYKYFEYLGYTVYVGRNARNNDELTFGPTHKDDLWLHARDVPGSHVIIKVQPGKPVPRPVIEKAASVAAFYSKRKNDTLCPVMLTQRKYVRKQKGMAAGMVKVEKSETVMAVPGEI